MPQRRTDVIEIFSVDALTFGLGGVVALIVAGVLYKFKGDGYTLGLIWVLAIAGTASIVWSLRSAFFIRKVKDYPVTCSYCGFENHLTAEPTDDFPCLNCTRLVPMLDGNVLPVSQVRCGFCGEQNYYSEKSEVLICENCDHEIPIAHEEGYIPRNLPKGFAIQDDTNLYDLVLVSAGQKHEEVIACLQHMLALNRSQVKQIINEVPVKLLTGINRRKAEMLQAQLSLHDAAAEFNPLP